MTPSYAQAYGATNDFLIQLIPLAFFWLLLVIFGYFIARRKGIGTLGIIIGTLPIWGFFVLLWWASKTDKDVLERLNRLEGSR
jgi:hypothetical protein